jgi:alkylhydroperoxidase family enzyme
VAAPTPRIPPGRREEIGLFNTAIVKVAGFAVGGDPPNVFTTLARHRALFRRWMGFAGKLLRGAELPRVDTELVILRVAHLTGSEYEWVQHEQLAQLTGLSAEDVARVKQGAQAPGWSPRQGAILAAVDQLVADNRIDDEVWERLAAVLEEKQLIELCILTGHYVMLAMTLNSLAVEPDPIGDPPRRLRWLSRR